MNDGVNNIFNVGTIPIADGEWKHIVLTADRDGDVITYINRTLGNVFAMNTIGDLSDLDVFSIGSDPLGDREDFIGTIDDVMIFNKTLNSEEIEAIYKNQKEGKI